MALRWWMLLVLFLVRIAMGYQFQTIASSSEHLMQAFGLSYAEVGALIGFFLLPGVLFAIPSGLVTRALADKTLLMIGALVMMVPLWMDSEERNESGELGGLAYCGARLEM